MPSNRKATHKTRSGKGDDAMRAADAALARKERRRAGLTPARALDDARVVFARDASGLRIHVVLAALQQAVDHDDIDAIGRFAAVADSYLTNPGRGRKPIREFPRTPSELVATLAERLINVVRDRGLADAIQGDRPRRADLDEIERLSRDAAIALGRTATVTLALMAGECVPPLSTPRAAPDVIEQRLVRAFLVYLAKNALSARVTARGLAQCALKAWGLTEVRAKNLTKNIVRQA